MKNSDILHSTILRKKFGQNQLTINQKPGNKLFIYHSFDSTSENYSGRWYNTQLTKKDYKLNKNKRQAIFIIKEYETETSVKKNVKVVITFTAKGWNKLLNLLE